MTATGFTATANAGAVAVPESASPRRQGRPGWPLEAIFVAFPLWWILGIQELVAMAMVIPMLHDLIRRPRISVPPAHGLWLLFLLWVVGGVAVLQIDAPYAVPGSSGTRYLTWAYRLAWYVVATVALLYVGNNRKAGVARISRALGTMFVTVVIGGLAGILLPTADFPSLMDLVLPAHMAHNGFVRSLVHPTFAQIQDVLGYGAPRPSAPFAFANIWGLNFACLLPFFVRGWMSRDAGWRRTVAPVVLIVALVPVIYSVNRGLWGALAAMALFMAVRSALQGRPAALAGTLAGLAVVAAVVLLSPLGGVVQARLGGENHTSNEGRTSLGTTTFKSVLEKSPILGYGTTRQVQGNFNSIAGGDSALCQHCSPPSFGTQGQLSLVTFSQGLVGAVFFLCFFLTFFLRHVRSRAPTALVCLTVVIASFVTMPIYNSLGFGLLEIMIACAILWREQPVVGSAPTLERQLRVISRHPAIVLVCVLTGVVAAGWWQHSRGVPATATVQVLLPRENAYVEQTQGRLSLDTLGGLATSESVVDATRAVRAPGDGDDPLTVQATPNTQILHLVYTSSSAPTAASAVLAAENAFLDEHAALLAHRREIAVRGLAARLDATSAAIDDANATLTHLRGSAPTLHHQIIRQGARDQRADAATEHATVQSQLSALDEAPRQRGRTVQPVEVVMGREGWWVALSAGALMGTLLAVLLGALRERHGGALRRPDDVGQRSGLPVVALLHEPGKTPRLPDEAARTSGRREWGARLLGDVAIDAFLTVDRPGRRKATRRSERTGAVAARLDALAHKRAPGSRTTPEGARRVVVVLTAGTRVREVERLQHRLQAIGSTVVGAVFVESCA